MARLQITVMFEVESDNISLAKHANYTEFYMYAFINAIYHEESLRELQYKGIKIDPILELI